MIAFLFANGCKTNQKYLKYFHLSLSLKFKAPGIIVFNFRLQEKGAQEQLQSGYFRSTGNCRSNCYKINDAGDMASRFGLGYGITRRNQGVVD